MSISEQIKHLKELSDAEKANVYSFEALSQSLREAADTIESLSAKLQAANTDNGGGWIACEDRLPEKSGIYEISFNTGNGSGHDFAEWRNGFFCVPADVIAWREHLKPYKSKQEDWV